MNRIYSAIKADNRSRTPSVPGDDDVGLVLDRLRPVVRMDSDADRVLDGALLHELVQRMEGIEVGDVVARIQDR